MLSFIKRKYLNLTTDQKFSEILTGSVYALAARVAATGLSLLTSIIVARYYGAEAMGTLAIVNSFLMLLTIFTVLGTGTSILRLIPEHITKYSATSAFLVYRKIQYLVAAISLVTGTIFFLAAGLVAEKVFSKPGLTFFLALAACFVVFKSLMDLNTQAVRGLKLMRIFAVLQILPSLVMLSALLAVTFFYRHPGNPVFAQLAAFLVAGVAGSLIMDWAFKKKRAAKDLVKIISVKEIAALSTPMLMTASMHFFMGQSGLILLGMFRPASEVGHYAVAVKLATLTVFVLQAINSMAAPKFSELYHGGKMDELFHIARKSTKLIFWTSMPILLVLLMFGKPILNTVFGQDFEAAYLAMVMLLIGQFVNSISGSTGHFLNMTGNQNILMNLILLAAITNIGLSLALVKEFGINGVAFAGMISLILWNSCALIYIKKKYGQTIGYLPYI
jgi:O-antigen/teichoic acid export membrane protein